MAKRPSIPSDIERQILIESGHRCAVCGEGCPLERAHIIPWHKSKEHKAEDLICLCANCHSRADSERWGERTLKEYKHKPWILRQITEMSLPVGPMAKVQFTIDAEVKQFDEQQQRIFKFAIAAFLGISPEAVQITSIAPGSVIISMEMSESIVTKLLDAQKSRDPEFCKYMAPWQILSVHLQEQQFSVQVRHLKAGLSRDIRKQVFVFNAPGAVSVQLVGDFTHWQERPINLQKAADGLWHTTVELEPGTHHYRFLVDGEWRDDPECAAQELNPYGGRNSIRIIR
jgi:hypothetical protein